MSARSRETPESEPPPKTVIPHVLCDCCSRIVRKSKIIQAFAAGKLKLRDSQDSIYIASVPEGFFHNHSVDYLSKSSAAGCHLCSLAVAQFDLGHERNYQSFVSVKIDRRHAKDTLRVIFEFHYACLKVTDELTKQVMDDFDYMDTLAQTLPLNFYPGDYITGLELTRFMSEGTLDSDATSIRDPLSYTSTNSLESIPTARAWIDNCLRNHPKCHRKPFDVNNTEYGLLPTRLIDIGTVDGKLAPRLILTSTSVNVLIQYLTLSHSWAITSSDSALKLTSRNLELLQIHIPTEGLPRTFQDAMRITQQLGYRYLWIDSLCIMQDSESDWHREALAMSSIYGNSACNIAALGVDGADTCFMQRNPLQVLPCQIKQQENGTGVCAGRRLELNTPLLRRGWVMQERLLPPRVLYTGAARLFWECCSRTASEGLPSQAGEQLLQPEHACVWVRYLTSEKYCTKSDFELFCGPQMSRPETNKMPQGLPCGTQDPRFTFAQAWLRIVRGYERTEFTYESDRLIALSGVAKAIEHSKGFTYVAGTWKELWPLDLLWWYRDWDSSKKEPTDVTKSKVPSWSWAARRWDKNFVLLNRLDFDILHEHQITYLARFDDFTCPTSTVRYTGTGVNEEEITLTIKGRVARYPVARRSSLEYWYVDGLKWDLDQTPKQGESLLFLLLICGKIPEDNDTLSKSGFNAGLALMLEEGVQKKDGQPCYKRVGLFFEERPVRHETWDEETICLC